MTPAQAKEFTDYCRSRVPLLKNSSIFLRYVDLAYDKEFKMPVNRGASNKARSANIAQFTRDAKSGKSKHIKTQSQAIAAAYSEQRAAKKKAAAKKRKKG